MSESAERRVVVLGAGVLGVTIATDLARHGQSVTLVTEAGLASGASGRSLAWLNAFHEFPDEYHSLRMAGINLYRELTRTRDCDEFLHFDGSVYWQPEGQGGLPGMQSFLAARNYPVEWFPGDATTASRFGLKAAVLPTEGILYSPGDGWVDLARLIGHFVDEFERLGGTVLRHTGSAGVHVENGAVRAVELADGSRLEADVVVDATGASVPRHARQLGVHIPERSPVSVLLRTKPVRHDVEVVVNSPQISVRPGLDQTLVLDHSWADEHVRQEADGRYVVPQPTVDRLLAAASEVLAGSPRLEADFVGVGLKPMPGDRVPVLGELATVPGYYVVFTHSGATLALLIGQLVSAEVRGEPSALLEPFRPSRFSAPELARSS